MRKIKMICLCQPASLVGGNNFYLLLFLLKVRVSFAFFSCEKRDRFPNSPKSVVCESNLYSLQLILIKFICIRLPWLLYWGWQFILMRYSVRRFIFRLPVPAIPLLTHNLNFQLITAKQ